MKKITLLLIFMAIAVFGVSAQTAKGQALKKQAQDIIYADKPVDAVMALSAADLKKLSDYSMGIDFQGVDNLNKTDMTLAFMLFGWETERRGCTSAQWRQKIKGLHKEVAPYMKGKDAATYIKLDHWLDLYELALL